jgi:hypothetical protein
MRLNMGIGCYKFVQNLRLLLLYSIPSFPFFRETWSVTLKEKHSLRIFENMVLRKVCGPQWNCVTGTEQDCIMFSFLFG